jgi:fucose permease
MDATRRPDAPETSLSTQMREGLAHVWHSRFLRAVVLVAAPLNFAILGAVFSATIVLRQQGFAASTIGLAQGGAALGDLLGAFVATALTRRLSLRQIVVIVTWILAGCLVAATLLTGRLSMMLPLAIGLFFAPAANAALFGHLAATTPDHLLGRVTSVVVLAATSAAALAPLATGTIIEHLDGKFSVLLCAVALAGSAVAATLSAGLARPPPRPSRLPRACLMDRRPWVPRTGRCRQR